MFEYIIRSPASARRLQLPRLIGRRHRRCCCCAADELKPFLRPIDSRGLRRKMTDDESRGVASNHRRQWQCCCFYSTLVRFFQSSVQRSTFSSPRGFARSLIANTRSPVIIISSSSSGFSSPASSLGGDSTIEREKVKKGAIPTIGDFIAAPRTTTAATTTT